ncbi:hypothetical protein ODQ17_14185 [Acinetobacter sp. IRS14]|uniref:hypothetical protein n=1 Tax=Acinetobacter sp. IRS14 TaxID=2983398 RepID=UPI002B002836|nr:hypothetical protein [Acinetobacter sp. IRS14]MEA1230519.1 hypothetical protein [Acinetobacter sp. IRS14]
MRSLHQVAASQLGIGVWYQKGFEQNGILFIRPNHYHPSEAMGAQCANCNTIVWITGRNDPILNEDLPEYAVNGGSLYRNYIENNTKRFLNSLPSCPACHQQAYDLFINNLVIPRYQNGDDPLVDKDHGINEEMTVKVKDKAVWWYGDQAEAKRLSLKFL